MLSKERYLGYFFTGPALIILTLVMVFPLAYGFIMSFFEDEMVLTQFVGLGNYLAVVKNPEIWQSLLLTLVFATSSTTLKLLLGMILALLLQHRSMFHSIARVLVLIPWMIAESIVGVTGLLI